MAQPLAGGAPGASGGEPPRREAGAAKGWSQQRVSVERRVHGAGSGGAAGAEAEEAVELVLLVTRLTMVTCLLLAGLKVAVYLLTGLSVVKTSAIDSVGDLLVTPVTMYTSWKMSRADPVAYPVGPRTMSVLGALVLSSVMAAAMFYNGVSNLAEVFVDQETSNEKAVRAFWASIFGAPCSMQESHAWEELRDGVRHMAHAGKFDMGDLSVLMRTVAVAPDFASACEEAVDVVRE
ncbi:unnamed protein product, partial [Prorocentrum cordatum]